MATDTPMSAWLRQVLRQHRGTQLAFRKSQGNNMTSTDNREWVDNIIAANGGEDTTHIIEYQNQFDGRTAWKLCRGEKMYTYAMETGSFIGPKLIWTQEETL
tara:strand:+ start:556 stop:861 length:306 start_codon:yes stop_codon:yes gene_type:complete